MSVKERRIPLTELHYDIGEPENQTQSSTWSHLYLRCALQLLHQASPHLPHYAKIYKSKDQALLNLLGPRA